MVWGGGAIPPPNLEKGIENIMHLKHRPKTWDEFIGNKTLIKAVKGITAPILFIGERGCGKTTLSHLIAKDFGAVKETTFEINCGDFKKDDVRGLVDSFNRSSLFGDKKCFILDEVHRLSELHGQSTLLTPLEHLRPDVLVVGCTTNIGGLIDPFLERFTRFKVAPLADNESMQLLNSVCNKENINLPRWLTALLIEQSGGIPRNLLTGLAVVQNVENKDEAAFLLETTKLEMFDVDTLDLFKLLMVNTGWSDVKRGLMAALKKLSPESIAIGLTNIGAGRAMSEFYRDAEKKKLLYMSVCMKRVKTKADLTLELLRLT